MMVKVPQEAMGLSPSYEGKHIIDRPLRVKSCKKCWSPLIVKSNKMYCKQCERFRNARTICWVDVRTHIRYLTPIELAAMMI